MITERDIGVLHALAVYYVLNRPSIQRLCYPDDSSGRITRRRLHALLSQDLVSRHNLVFHHPQAGSPGPVYYPSRRGCEFLAEYFEDEKYLMTPTQTPQSHHAFHWLAVSETHIAIDQAIAAQSEVHLDGWLNEWDVANKDESAPEKRYRIYTLLNDSPRLVCAPDAAFLLRLGKHRKVFYLEQDRDTSGVRRVAASKTKGYAELVKRQAHRRHFPPATVSTITVLLVAPTPRRRDALRREFRDKPGADLWKFAAATELTAYSFLHGSIFYPCKGEAMSLVKNSHEDDPDGPALPASTKDATQNSQQAQETAT
jgi:hypothetical protein